MGRRQPSRVEPGPSGTHTNARHFGSAQGAFQGSRPGLLAFAAVSEHSSQTTDETPSSRVKAGLSLDEILAGVVVLWAVMIVGIVSFVVIFFGDSEETVAVRREVRIELSDFEIQPDVVDVARDVELVFLVENVGEGQHDLTIGPDRTTGRLKPGESAQLVAGPTRESYSIWCSIKGHRALGMEARIEVER